MAAMAVATASAAAATAATATAVAAATTATACAASALSNCTRRSGSYNIMLPIIMYHKSETRDNLFPGQQPFQSGSF